MFKLAIGIPTLNRPNDLDLTLRSILNNTILPNKIIIADQSDNNETFELIKNYKESSNVEFVYLRIKEKGLTHARNVILENLDDTDIITFLDDDVTLSEQYIENVLNTFLYDKNITGVQGFIVPEKKKVIKELLKFKIKKITSPPKVYENFKNTYPLLVKKGKLIPSQWLSGCNMSYRIKYIKGEKFEEQFILYSLGEDLEFSYRLYLKGKKLLMNTSALMMHRVSKIGRLPSKANLIMRFGYRRFMIAKYRKKEKIDELFESYVNMYKSEIAPLKFKSRKEYEKLLRLIDESLFIIKQHHDQIDKLNLESLNKVILKELRK